MGTVKEKVSESDFVPLWDGTIMHCSLPEVSRGHIRVNPISLSYPFPFVLPLALVPRNRVVSARGENIPL